MYFCIHYLPQLTYLTHHHFIITLQVLTTKTVEFQTQLGPCPWLNVSILYWPRSNVEVGESRPNDLKIS